MSDVSVDVYLEYLQTWKTRKEICSYFNLSYTECYHMLQWLVKAKLIQKKEVTKEESVGLGFVKIGQTFIYKAIPQQQGA